MNAGQAARIMQADATARQLADETDIDRIRRNDKTLELIDCIAEYLTLHHINEMAAYDVAVETVNDHLETYINEGSRR